MSDTIWAVTLVYLRGAVTDEQFDQLVGAYAGSDASFSLSDTEFSVIASAENAHSNDARFIVESPLANYCSEHGIALGALVEDRTVAWDRWEAELEQPNFPDIVSAPEVGEILGVSRQRVHQLINENKSFPPPIVRLGSGPIWLRATIEAFDRSWTRKPGRPKLDVTEQTILNDPAAGSANALSAIAERRAAKDAELESRRTV